MIPNQAWLLCFQEPECKNALGPTLSPSDGGLVQGLVAAAGAERVGLFDTAMAAMSTVAAVVVVAAAVVLHGKIRSCNGMACARKG